MDAQAGLAAGDDGEAEGDDHDAKFHEPFALLDGLGVIADHDGDDGGGRIVAIEAQVAQSVAHFFDISVQLLDPRRLPFNDLDGFAGATGHRGGEGIGKQAGPAALDQ